MQYSVGTVCGRVRVRARLGIQVRICARTTARYQRPADKDHKKQNQNIRRQTNLCMMADCSCNSSACRSCKDLCRGGGGTLYRYVQNDPAMAMVTVFLVVVVVVVVFFFVMPVL